jgi:hypothetical protein
MGVALEDGGMANVEAHQQVLTHDLTGARLPPACDL